MRRKKSPAATCPATQPPADWQLWRAVAEASRVEVVFVAATSWFAARAAVQRYAAAAPGLGLHAQLQVDRHDGRPAADYPLLWVEEDPCVPFGHLRVTRTP